MTAITAAEVRPGLSVFLDPAVLLTCPECVANVRSRANLVNRPGPFLVVAAVGAEQWLCTPLVSHSGANRLALDPALKSGPGMGWLSRPSYFSVHQFWLIPTRCLIDASTGEFSPTGTRQRYADASPAALQEIERHRFDSDAPYRPVAELR